MQPKKPSTARGIQAFMKGTLAQLRKQGTQPERRRKVISLLVSGRMAEEMKELGKTIEEHPEFKPQALRRAVRNLMHSLNPDVKEAALFDLIRLNAREAIPAIERALKDKNTDVRLLAVWGLGELQSVDSIPLLQKAFNHDADETVKTAAWHSLGKLFKLQQNK